MTGCGRKTVHAGHMQGTSPSFPLRELNESVHFRTLSRSIRSETRGGRFARRHRQQKWFREAHVFETAAGGHAQHYTFWVTYAKGGLQMATSKDPSLFLNVQAFRAERTHAEAAFRVFTRIRVFWFHLTRNHVCESCTSCKAILATWRHACYARTML